MQTNDFIHWTITYLHGVQPGFTPGQCPWPGLLEALRTSLVFSVYTSFQIYSTLNMTVLNIAKDRQSLVIYWLGLSCLGACFCFCFYLFICFCFCFCFCFFFLIFNLPFPLHLLETKSEKKISTPSIYSNPPSPKYLWTLPNVYLLIFLLCNGINLNKCVTRPKPWTWLYGLYELLGFIR